MQAEGMAASRPAGRPAAGRPTEVEVSVIVPARNEERLLAGCLRSLSCLDPFDGRLEVIVVDNDSSDRTPEIARSMGATVLKTRARTIAAVRNEGARIARGRLLAFLDADCTVDTAWLRNAARRFNAPRVVAVGSYPRGPASGASWLQEAWPFLVARPAAAAREATWLPAANLVVRASAFRQVSGFDPSLETCEDVDLCYRLGSVGAIVDDASVRVVHLREPRTLGQFFRREVWHGRDSYDRIRRGRFFRPELPSLLVPVVSLVSLLLMNAGLILALAGRGRRCFWAGAVGLATPPLLYTARSVITKGRALDAPRFWLIYLTYFLARGVALVARVLEGWAER